MFSPNSGAGQDADGFDWANGSQAKKVEERWDSIKADHAKRRGAGK